MPGRGRRKSKGEKKKSKGKGQKAKGKNKEAYSGILIFDFMRLSSLFLPFAFCLLPFDFLPFKPPSPVRIVARPVPYLIPASPDQDRASECCRTLQLELPWQHRLHDP